MRMSKRLAGVAGMALSLGAAAMAGPGPTYTVLYQDNDFVLDIGAVTSFNSMAVNSNGSWLVEVVTNHFDANANVVVIRDGQVRVRENDAVAPPPAAISSFDSINLNIHGNSGWNFFLRNMTSSTDSGVYFNTTLVIPESMVSTASGFSDGTPYIGFFDVKINDQNRMLVMASVDDPLIASSVDRAIVLVEVDGDGNLVSETVIAKEGDILPGQTEAVADFATGPHGTAFNNAGDIMYVADLTGDTNVDGVVYLNGTILAQEGAPAPATGRNWRILSSSTKVGLNNTGGHVYTGTMDGDTATDAVIVKSGRIFKQEGETFPAIAPYSLTGFGTGPVHIADNGDVLWYGTWNNPDTTRNHGLFLNETLLIQRGETFLNGLTVTTVRGIEDGYHMSPSGRYILARVVLGTNVDAMVMIDMGEASCPADWNNDGVVNSTDLSAFITSWLDSVQNGNLNADFNGDNAVNSTDLSAFITAWLSAVQNGC